MRTALALAAFLVAGPAMAEPTVKQLLAAEARATLKCQGSTNIDEVPEACSWRDRLVGRLSQSGYCFGRIGQLQGQKEWHPCGANSIRTDDLKEH